MTTSSSAPASAGASRKTDRSGEARGPRVLLYSDDKTIREQVRLAVGSRVAQGDPDIEWLEIATPAAVITAADAGNLDLMILDGEADKVGGMGLCRQLKNEIFNCPPVVVLTARPQDGWLASWSLADAAISRPFDPIGLRDSIVSQLRG